MAEARPTVSVIVPFKGSDDQLEQLLRTLSRIVLGPGDEVLVADNRPVSHSFTAAGRIDVREAGAVRTPAYARNRAAEAARGEWLLFIDADTVPPPSLIDDYFDRRPDTAAAVLAGGIVDSPRESDGLTARYALAHAHMSQAATMRRDRPYAQTANCAVLRRAFVQIGGFTPSARAGEDADLCFRLLDAGWELEARPEAVVKHRGRDSVGGLLAQLARHGSGAAWADRRFPGTFPPASPGQLARRLARSAREAVRRLGEGDRQAAALEALDMLAAFAYELGRLLPNERPARLRLKRHG